MDSWSTVVLGPISSSVGPVCSACFVVAEVANVVIGTFVNSGVTATGQLLIGTTSFTVEVDFDTTLTHTTIIPAPTPLTTYDFSSTFALSGETLSFPTAYYVFSAYSVTSAYPNASSCATFNGPRLLTGPLAVSIPLPTDQARFASDVETAIASYIAPTRCAPVPLDAYISAIESNVAPTTATSIRLQLSTIAISLPARQTDVVTTMTSSTSASQSTISSPLMSPSLTPSPSYLATEAKIGIGIGIPSGVITLIVLPYSIWIWYRRKRSKLGDNKTGKRKIRSGWRAYLQNKGELDAEEQRRHEVENGTIWREVDAEEQAMCEAEGTKVQAELDSGIRCELEVPERKHELKGG